MPIDFSGLTVRSGAPLIQDTVAAHIRKRIIDGSLKPGDPLVEGKWARDLSVAQSSIRAALHILEDEGLVERGNGRSVRVTLMTHADIDHNFQVRSALEALAARLTTERRQDVTHLEQAVADMRVAVQCRNLQAFYQSDLRFHLILCEKSGNPVLSQILSRLLLRLFAFVIIRTHEKMDGPRLWLNSIEQHAKIVDVVRTGDPTQVVPEVNRVMGYFAGDIDGLTRKKAIKAR